MIRTVSNFEHLDFDIVSYFVLRASDLEFSLYISKSFRKYLLKKKFNRFFSTDIFCILPSF